MPIPTKPSIRQTHRARASLDAGLFWFSAGLIWPLIKIGFLILGAIAMAVLVGVLLFQFIRATMPMSLIALAIIGFTTWLIIKHA